jgi:hypothetical protein
MNASREPRITKATAKLASSVLAVVLLCVAPRVAQAEDLRFHGIWLGPTFSMPFVPPLRAEWGGEFAVFYGTRTSRTGLGFDFGATTERAYADALFSGQFSKLTGWFLHGGVVLGYGVVDGVGGRVGVSGWAAPFIFPLVGSVNVIAIPNAPLLVLGTFSIKIGGGF